MLKKLLKYDLQNVFKILVIFYGLSIFFALLTRIFLGIDNSFIINIIGKICSGVTISMIFNILINNVMRLWVRYKNNFYSDEGYLTHTLPVTKNKLHLSKLLTSIITMFISILVIAFSLFIAYYSKENLMMVKNFLLPLAEIYESTILKILVAFIFICFLEILNMIQAGCIGIVLGHKRNNNKFGFSILYGFATYMLTQVFAIFMVFIVALFNTDLMNLFYTVDTLNVEMIKLCIYLALVIYSISNIALYFINSKIFKQGVNLD